MKKIQITAEALAYWYFRLNGFFTFTNFVVHHDRRGESGTDVDILGVRFPYRAELFEDPMEDDKKFTCIKNRPYIVIAEVTSGRCKLNGPWTVRKAKNMDYFLRAIGAFQCNEEKKAIEDLYEKGMFENSSYHISLCCIGSKISKKITKKYPDIPQLTWEDIKEFICTRFREYRNQKSWHPSWDKNGQELWNCAKNCRKEKEFLQAVQLEGDDS